MPKLTQEEDLELVPELSVEDRALLLQEIALYESLCEDRDELDAALVVMKGRLDAMRDDLGDGAKKLVPAEGFALTLVEGTSSSLDKKALMKAFAITPKQWTGFMRTKPKKAYLLVTTPKATAKEVAAKAARVARDDRDEEDDRE